METRAHYAAVGAFVVTMIVIAFAAVLWLARGALNTQYARYEIYFEGPVTGLRPAAEVDYNGVPVGKVSEVRIAPSNVERIQVIVEIDAEVAIKTDARASVETNILSGVSYIQIVGGTRDAPLLGLEGGQRYPVIGAHRSRLASVTARAPQLLEKLNDVAERLYDLLDDKNRRAFGEAIESLRIFTAGLADRNQDLADLTSNAKVAAASLADLIGNVDRSYSGPDGIGKQMAGALENIDRLARNLADTNHQLQLGLQDVRPGLRNFSQQTLGQIGGLVAEVRQLVAGLRQVAGQLERDPSRLLFGDRREGYRSK